MIMKDYKSKIKGTKPTKRQARYLEDKHGHAQLNCMVESKLYTNFKVTAYANNLTVKEAVSHAFEDFVQKHK